MDQKEQHKRDLLRRWISGEITAREESELRRSAQEDEALRDAFAAYEGTAQEDHAARLARVRARIAQPAGAKVRSLLVWQVAAAVLLLFAVAWWLIPITQDNAMSAPLAVEESAPADDDFDEVSNLSDESAQKLPTEAGTTAKDADPGSFTASASAREQEEPLATAPDKSDFLAAAGGAPEERASDSEPMPTTEAFSYSDLPVEEETIGRASADSAIRQADAVALEVEETPADPLATSPPAPPPAAAAEKRTFPTQNQGYPSRLDDRMRATNAGPPVANNGFRIIEGKVLDHEGYPLIGASVLEEGTANGTVTDFDGFYRIAVAEDNARLQVSYTGYDAQLIAVAQDSELDIVMEESASLLDEVVVTGLGVDRRREQTSMVGSVVPTDGFRALRRYINQQTPVNTPRTRIRVQFVVQADGSLSNFEVLNSTNTAYNDFAIELLQNGPAWQVEEGNAPITAVYIVRLKG